MGIHRCRNGPKSFWLGGVVVWTRREQRPDFPIGCSQSCHDDA